MFRPTRRAWLGLVAGAAAAAAGCERRTASPVGILTRLRDDRLDRVLERLAGSAVRLLDPSPMASVWVAHDRGVRSDIVLGGPWWQYDLRLPDRSAWIPIEPVPVGLWVTRARAEKLGAGESAWALTRDVSALGLLRLDDPLRGGALFTAAVERLAGDWHSGYAELVGWAGQSGPVARPLLGAANRCAPPVAFWGVENAPPDNAADWRFVASPDSPLMVEGAAVLDRSSRAESLRRAIEAAGSTTWDGVPDSPGRPAWTRSAGSLELLADLLHATLVEAQPELERAWSLLAPGGLDGGRLERAFGWLVQPPPWPPASVALLQSRSSARQLITTLARQLVSTPARSEWLTDLFLGNKSALDGETLLELASHDSGGLSREPRFRAWLRGEWRAWAQQRYRRAARLAEGKVESA